MNILESFMDFLSGKDGGLRGIMAMVGMSIITNLISAVLQLGANDRIPQLLWTALAILFALVAIYKLRKKSRGVVYVTERQKPKAYRGLILLVSKGRVDRKPWEQSAGAAIGYHSGLCDVPGALERCWLIATDGPQGSLQYAREIEEACKELGVRAYVESVADGFSPQETYTLVRQIYAEAKDKFGLEPEEIISDFTGALKPMSIGMALACADQYPMQYMYGGQPDIESVPRKIEFKSA